MSEKNISLTLRVWRQAGPHVKGQLITYHLDDVSTDMSFLEMIDVLNEKLTLRDEDPIAFDHDCREGICGMCGAVVDGQVHGPETATTLCQLHMRHFTDGDTIIVEPFRSRAFPIIKDLVVDRSGLDKIIQAGGYISASTGGSTDANAMPIPTQTAEEAMDAAACIGCGACVASCPNASAMLFAGAKVSQLALLPQGKAEREKRVWSIVHKMDELGFGNCSNERECEATCPKEISISHIARFNREFTRAAFVSREK
ncbi:succinate dehydrogenase/fumarate reductase iron-sulfur subunit [bacterium]|nr:succinate dehydrogenase/fumarate reductase iron-sulfur subunit [bacterium]